MQSWLDCEDDGLDDLIGDEMGVAPAPPTPVSRVAHVGDHTVNMTLSRHPGAAPGAPHIRPYAPIGGGRGIGSRGGHAPAGATLEPPRTYISGEVFTSPHADPHADPHGDASGLGISFGDEMGAPPGWQSGMPISFVQGRPPPPRPDAPGAPTGSGGPGSYMQSWARWQQVHPDLSYQDYANWLSQYGAGGGTIL
jgi:hypothetical protein